MSSDSRAETSPRQLSLAATNRNGLSERRRADLMLERQLRQRRADGLLHRRQRRLHAVRPRRTHQRGTITIEGPPRRRPPRGEAKRHAALPPKRETRRRPRTRRPTPNRPRLSLAATPIGSARGSLCVALPARWCRGSSWLLCCALTTSASADGVELAPPAGCLTDSSFSSADGGSGSTWSPERVVVSPHVGTLIRALAADWRSSTVDPVASRSAAHGRAGRAHVIGAASVQSARERCSRVRPALAATSRPAVSTSLVSC